MPSPIPKAVLPSEIEQHIERTPSCWLWTGDSNQAGYGRARISGRRTAAHRVVYELLRGRIPCELTLDHLCRNRACVNPAHLEPVTVRENILRGEGIAARNAKKTHCPKHCIPLEQTRLKRIQRRCPECHRLYQRAWIRRRRANAVANA